MVVIRKSAVAVNDENEKEQHKHQLLEIIMDVKTCICTTLMVNYFTVTFRTSQFAQIFCSLADPYEGSCRWSNQTPRSMLTIQKKFLFNGNLIQPLHVHYLLFKSPLRFTVTLGRSLLRMHLNHCLWKKIQPSQVEKWIDETTHRQLPPHITSPANGSTTTPTPGSRQPTIWAKGKSPTPGHHHPSSSQDHPMSHQHRADTPDRRTGDEENPDPKRPDGSLLNLLKIILENNDFEFNTQQ